jgi:dihydroflavonol-4-reductase
MRLGARFNPMLDQLVPNLGVHSRVSTRKAQELLGWHPRPARVTLVDTARSLIDKHLV